MSIDNRNPGFPGNSRIWFTLLCIAFVAAHLPSLSEGYGADGDAWRVAYSGHLLWNTGRYEPSRFPGYPLHELISAPLVAAGGPLLSNAATLGATLLVLLLWYRIARHHGRHPLLLAVTFALTPLVWINAASTMDYLWSLLFILLALDAAMRGRLFLVGFAAGLAAGFRPSNIVILIPLLVLISLQFAGGLRHTGRVLLGAATSLILAFLPPLLTFGPAGWILATRQDLGDVVLPVAERVLFFLYRSTYAIGPLAVLATAILLGTCRRELLDRLRRRDPLVMSSLAALATFLLLFFQFPLEREYLLPAIPFLYLLVDRFSSQRFMILFAASVISFGVINPDVVIHRTPVGTPGWNVHAGMIPEGSWKRSKVLDERRKIGSMELPDRSMVMTGRGPILWFQNPLMEADVRWKNFHEPVHRKKGEDDVLFVYVLRLEEVRDARGRGYAVYALPTAQHYLRRAGGYDPTEEEVLPIPDP